MSAAIVGWAHTLFGKQDAETVESLIVRVAVEALAELEGAAGGHVDRLVRVAHHVALVLQRLQHAHDGGLVEPGLAVDAAHGTPSGA